MLGHRRFWPELFGLILGYFDNPLARRSAPWRRGVPMLLFAVLQVLGGILMAGWYAKEALRSSGNDLFESSILFIFLTFIAAPVNLVVYAAYWKDKERAQDLYLTLLTPREQAFGAVFWGVVMSLVLPLLVWWGLAVQGIVEIVRTLTREGANSYWVTNIIYEITMLLSALMGIVVINSAACLKVWFYPMRNSWVIIFVGPMISVAFNFLGIMGLLLMMGLAEELFEHNLAGLLGLLGYFFLVAVAVRSACKLAPSLFIRHINMEPYIINSVIANDTIRLYRRELRPIVRQALREHVRIPWGPSAIAFALGAGATLLMSMIAMALDDSEFTLINSERAMLGLFVAVVVLYRLLRRKGERVKLVSGGMIESVWRLLFPLFVFALLALSVWEIGESVAKHGIRGSVEFVLGSFFVSLGVLVSLVTLVSGVVYAMGCGRNWRVVLVSAAGLVLLALNVMGLNGGRRYSSSIWNMEFLPSELHVLTAMFFGMLIYNTINVYQRLYEKRVMGLPPGTVVVMEN